MTLANVDQTQISVLETDPEQEILFQTKVATALMKVVKQNANGKFVTKLNGKDFLGFEAWQTIARMNQCNVVIDSTEPIFGDMGEIIAYDSWASVTRPDGQVVAKANMECGMDSFPTRGKKGREKHKACKSTSQTWAGSKACRMAFSFVAVLAGFEATTAEEMVEDNGQQPTGKPATRRKSAHFCEEHNSDRKDKDSNGNYYHPEDKNFCVEGIGMLNAKGQLIPEPEPDPTPEQVDETPSEQDKTEGRDFPDQAEH